MLGNGLLTVFNDLMRQIASNSNHKITLTTINGLYNEGKLTRTELRALVDAFFRAIEARAAND